MTLELLTELAETEATPLATHTTTWPLASDESLQLTRVLAVLHTRFAEPIRVEDLCAAGNLSPRTLHRLFVRHLGENVTEYLGRLRVGRACMLLAETNPTADISRLKESLHNLTKSNLTNVTVDRSKIKEAAGEALRRIETLTKPARS
jgi:AraC-like DNA-binding protein